THLPHVDLIAPFDGPADRVVRVSGGGEPGDAGGLFDVGGDQLGRERRVRGQNRVTVVGVEAVEANQRVVVDHAATLVLGDLGIREADLGTAFLGDLAQAAVEGHGGAPPQLRGVQVPHGLMVVVVAVQADRFAELWVVFGVALVADDLFAVLADSAGAADAARLDLAVGADHAGVDRAEGRRGEGDEEARVSGDRFGHALATEEAGLHQVISVLAVGLCAGGTDGGAAVLAGHVDQAVRHVVGDAFGL